MSPSASYSFDNDASSSILPTPSGMAPGAEAVAPELARLEECLARVHHECAIALLAATPHARAKYRGPRLPPAAQLAPVAGIPPVRPDTPAPVRRAPGGMREPLPFHLAPPLATERLQPPRPQPQPNRRLRGALYILIASLIAGSTGYQLAGAGSSVTEAAHAALAVVAGSK